MGDGDEGDFWSTAPAEGYSVCADCFDDLDIQAFIASSVDELACDFCDKSSADGPVAAPLEGVVEFMVQAIDREYDRAVNALGWESAEGGFQGSHWDSNELLTEQIDIALPSDDGRLLDILVDCLGDNDWCERNPYSLREDERYIASWEQFCNFIKYERRYFFLEPQRQRPETGDGELLSPPSLLQFISETVVDYRLLTTIPTGSIIYRARQLKPGQTVRSSLDFGPPPVEKATRSNRMSPAGIVMFYGSGETDTAVAEIDDKPELGIAVGTFRTLRDLRVVDLTRLPRPLRFFEPQPETSIENRYVLSFLNNFGASLAARVEPGDREHIDYVPTQVVTEWFRTTPLDNEPNIDGILYRSTQRAGGSSLVLFADQSKIAFSEDEVAASRREPGRGHFDYLDLAQRQRHGWLQLTGSNFIRQPQPI
jgi:hypothetical protein